MGTRATKIRMLLDMTITPRKLHMPHRKIIPLVSVVNTEFRKIALTNQRSDGITRKSWAGTTHKKITRKVSEVNTEFKRTVKIRVLEHSKICHLHPRLTNQLKQPAEAPAASRA